LDLRTGELDRKWGRRKEEKKKWNIGRITRRREGGGGVGGGRKKKGMERGRKEGPYRRYNLAVAL
jgi:hypothetical protein